MKLALARRLRPLPDLGEHQVAASQLATNGMDGPIYQSDHIGRTIAVRAHGTLLVGKLTSVTDSATEPLIVLRIGSHQIVAVHPAHPITVAPVGYRLAVVFRIRAALDAGEGQ